MTQNRLLPLAAGYGAIAGLRTFSAPTALARAAREGIIHLETTPLAFAGRTVGAHAIALAALGELIADKTEFIGDRTAPSALVGRAVSGAMVGGSIARAYGKSWKIPALIGAAAAIGAAFGGYELRRRAGEATGLPDLAFALIEDAIVIAAGVGLVSAVKG